MLSNADKKWMNETTSEENVSDLKRPTTAYWSINYVDSIFTQRLDWTGVFCSLFKNFLDVDI